MAMPTAIGDKKVKVFFSLTAVTSKVTFLIASWNANGWYWQENESDIDLDLTKIKAM